MAKLSVQECRTLLGDAATGKSDADIERLRDDLAAIASDMYDHLARQTAIGSESLAVTSVALSGIPVADAEQLQRDALERIRWTAYSHEQGVDDEGAE